MRGGIVATPRRIVCQRQTVADGDRESLTEMETEIEPESESEAEKATRERQSFNPI